MAGPFVTTINTNLAKKLKTDLTAQGFELTTPQYTLFAAKKKDISCTLYESGKLVVQGKGMTEFIEFYLEPEILQEFSYTNPEVDESDRIGIDESGKGDFFGPLCIAGVYAPGKDVLILKKLGVQDSKKITDASIEKISKQICANFAHHIVKINPLKYNELHAKFGNLNHLLAWGHATTIENLVQRTDCHNVIIDQFAAEGVVVNALKRKHLDLNLTQRHRAEEDLVVAAASILARAAFLNGLQRLSDELGISLPKGASTATIQAGRKLVRKYGNEILQRAAKVHFKTTKEVLE